MRETRQNPGPASGRAVVERVVSCAIRPSRYVGAHRVIPNLHVPAPCDDPSSRCRSDTPFNCPVCAGSHHNVRSVVKEDSFEFRQDARQGASPRARVSDP